MEIEVTDCDCTNSGSHFEWVLFSTDCTWISGGGGGGNNNDGDNGNNEGNNGSSSGQSDSSSGSNPHSNDTTFTHLSTPTITFDFWENVVNCLNLNPPVTTGSTTNPDNVAKVNWLQTHKPTAESLSNYINNKGCNKVTKSIVMDAIEALMNDPTLTFEQFLEKYNCIKLNELLETDGANLTSSMQYLRDNISPTGEKGVQFQKNGTGNYTNPIITSTTNNKIDIKVKNIIGGRNVIYGAGHNHPMDTFPMPSWSDVYLTKNLYYFAENDVRGLSTFMLASKENETSTAEIYAIKVDNYITLRSKINSDLANIHLIHHRSDTISMETRIELLDKDLKKKYQENPSNTTQEFLENFDDYGISIYKANTTLDGWSKLSIDALGTIIEYPCN